MQLMIGNILSEYVIANMIRDVLTSTLLINFILSFYSTTLVETRLL